MFDRLLLEESAEKRINFFVQKVIGHPRLLEAMHKIEQYLSVSDVNNIMLVYGPSGVGKTTLFRKLVEKIYQQNKINMETDKGFIPVLPVEAIAPEDSDFNWKDFYIRSLNALNEPLVGHKVSISEDENTKRIVIKNSETTPALRRSLENAIKYRKPSVIMIDEGQHMMKMKSGKKFLDQMDRIKSLAATTNTPIILFGTYQLLNFRNLSGQLIRRGMDIDFPRYKATESDLLKFRNVLWSFQQYLPLEEEPNLIQHEEYFYQRTIGCIGILKQWMDKTLKYHLKQDPKLKTLSIDNFKDFELSMGQCVKLAKEATEGEMILAETGGTSELQELLGLKKDDNGGNTAQDTKKVLKKHKGRPGERKPKRDVVGNDDYEQ